MDINETIIKKIIEDKIEDKEKLSKIKRKTAKRFDASCPKNVELLQVYHNLLKDKRIEKNIKIERILRKRPVRSLSGVSVVSVFTNPYPCPGECVFCPSEEGLPKSYLRGEPAAERALKLNFDPFLQVQKRIESLKKQGHPIDKIEIRVIGATFSYYPEEYKINFFTNLFAAANKRKPKKITNKNDLELEQKLNEKSENRIVGISVETRPDFINEKEILLMRELGVTMVEIGAQTVFDDVLKKCKRGHTKKASIEATKLLKDAGLKVLYQMMPNLPGSNLKKDLEAFEEIFNNQDYKPDWLKIYPCLVCKGAELYKMWKRKEFVPHQDEELTELLIKIKKIIPYWVRLARLFRDIPSQKIEAGSTISNIRELAQKRMKEQGLSCKCIRCREVKQRYNPKEKIYLFKEEYKASRGKEIFLSFENKKRDKLFAFLRLRIPSQIKENKKHFITVLENSTIIRELHTYGQQIPIEEKGAAPQHKGLGKKLIKEAEKITKEEKIPKISVISGVGVREYYRKLDYKLKKDYMVKRL